MDSIVSVVSFILVLGVLVFIHEAGHFTMAKLAGIKVEEFGFGFPPRLFAVRRGETEYSINLIPLGGFVRMLGEEDPSEPRSFARASKRWRTGILVAGPGMNILMAALLFAGGYMAGWPTATEVQVEVTSVVPASPAEQAGVRVGDAIVSLGGTPIADTSELRSVTQQHLGKETTLVVRRDGAEHSLTITPSAEWNPERGALGVTIINQALTVEPVSYPVDQAIRQGLQRTGDVIGFTLGVPAMLLQGLIPAEAARPVGPVGIFQFTSQAAVETVSSGWWFPILYVMAILSVGLGVANILPIPGLDGGRLLFVIIEAIRGKRISPEREGLIHLVGVAALLALVLVISFYDVTSPIPTLDWGAR